MALAVGRRSQSVEDSVKNTADWHIHIDIFGEDRTGVTITYPGDPAYHVRDWKWLRDELILVGEVRFCNFPYASREAGEAAATALESIAQQLRRLHLTENNEPTTIQ